MSDITTLRDGIRMLIDEISMICARDGSSSGPADRADSLYFIAQQYGPLLNRHANNLGLPDILWASDEDFVTPYEGREHRQKAICITSAFDVARSDRSRYAKCSWACDAPSFLIIKELRLWLLIEPRGSKQPTARRLIADLVLSTIRASSPNYITAAEIGAKIGKSDAQVRAALSNWKRSAGITAPPYESDQLGYRWRIKDAHT